MTLGLGACVNEHPVLESDEQDAAPNAGGSAGQLPAPPFDDCLQALAFGQSGDACTMPFVCSYVEDCCQRFAQCEGGRLTTTSTCEPCPECLLDEECAFGEICRQGQCSACPEMPPCPMEWQTINRNGCAFCVPPSACATGMECAPGETCYPGAACLPGCERDPSCCFGSLCAPLDCPPPENLDCSVIGCPEMYACVFEPPVRFCKCEPMIGWLCNQDMPPGACSMEP
jgi:hypothetical protein